MQCVVVCLLALATLAAAVGQFYVPRAYYTIDAEGHPSPPIALRRLRRSIQPYPHYPGAGADANANANANAWSGDSRSANANANANAYTGGRGYGGGWAPPPSGPYGFVNPIRV